MTSHIWSHQRFSSAMYITNRPGRSRDTPRSPGRLTLLPLLNPRGVGITQCIRRSEMDQTTQTSPQSSTNPLPLKKRREECSDLLLAFEDLQDHERREIGELEVRLKKIEDTQSWLLNVIIRHYQRCQELANRLDLESQRVRGEIKRRTEALQQLETTPTPSTMKP